MNLSNTFVKETVVKETTVKVARVASLAFLMLFAIKVIAQDSIIVSDIRVSGLQRITAGSIFNFLPV